MTVVGQHPKGFGTHLRNLTWAVGVAFTPYLITFKGWKIDHPYLIEVDANPMDYYHFWGSEVPTLIRSLDADVLIMSESDVFYTEDIRPLIEECHQSGRIFINTGEYGGYAIYNGEKQVYPRLWEGGMILPVKLLQKALADGIGLDIYVINEKIKEKAAEYVGYYFQRRREMIPLEQLELTNYDTLFEFTLYCFFNGVEVREHNMACHIPFPEMAHRFLPEVYTEPIGQAVCDKFLKEFGAWRIMNWPAIVALYYICGAVEKQPIFNQWWYRAHFWTVERMKQLQEKAPQWMNDEELLRLKDVMTVMTPSWHL